MNSGKAICTIIAKNYIAFARTLCDSFLDLHPDGKCYVLIIDDYQGYIAPEKERFQVIALAEIGIKDLVRFCFKYNITELSTATKPYLIDYLFRIKSERKILYLDPDILVTERLDLLYEELDRTDVLLTPHLDKDYPDDGLLPDDAHILKSGIYNLGFVGLRNCENTSSLLAWWQGKVYDKCVIDHGRGYFVDQRFIDLATTLFRNISPIQDPGYNVAYWNLHSRKIGVRNRRWTCNGGLLYFYHFSNYKAEFPEEISGHQTRYTLLDLPDLRELFHLYRSMLIRNGYEETRKWPYSHDRFEDGARINDLFRKFYRISVAAQRAGNPFDRKGFPVRYRLLLPLTSILQELKSFATRYIKESPFLRKLAEPFLGPLQAGKASTRQGGSRTRST